MLTVNVTNKSCGKTAHVYTHLHQTRYMLCFTFLTSFSLQHWALLSLSGHNNLRQGNKRLMRALCLEVARLTGL